MGRPQRPGQSKTGLQRRLIVRLAGIGDFGGAPPYSKRLVLSIQIRRAFPVEAPRAHAAPILITRGADNKLGALYCFMAREVGAGFGPQSNEARI